MNDMMSEAQLLQASAAGSKEAFGTVVRHYQALVCAVTYSAIGDVGRSEELAQETFIRAWRNLRQLEDPGKFRVWLCTIARNLANTSLRGSRRDAAHPLERAAGPSAAGPGPDEAALAKERQEIVWAAVGRVPLKYREPLVLFYRRQRSVSEVAADLDLSEETVRQRLHRGRQLIKAEVSSLVEDTLVGSGPGKTFAVAVIAALPALITTPASAAVAGVAAKGAPAAKMLAAAGFFYAILGAILGLLNDVLIGDVLGLRLSLMNPDSPREHRLMIRLAIVWLLLFLALLGLLTLAFTGLIPMWTLVSCLAVYFVLLLALILWAKTGQRRIRAEEHTEHLPTRINLGALYGGVGGGIFGATGWLLVQAWLAKDWVSLGAILALDILVFLVVTRVYMHIRKWH
jgi:RNA polymerase sigma factor (sigma-70 family)